MNSPINNIADGTDGMYVILGASGNTGSIIVDSLLSMGKKVRVSRKGFRGLASAFW